MKIEIYYNQSINKNHENIKEIIKKFNLLKEKSINFKTNYYVSNIIDIIDIYRKKIFYGKIGCELKIKNIKKLPDSKIFLIIKNSIGYKEFCYIINKIWIRYKKNKSNKLFIKFNELNKIKNIEILLDTKGYIISDKINNKYSKIIKLLKYIKKNTTNFKIKLECNSTENIKNNKKIVLLSKILKIKVLYTFDINILKKTEKKSFEIENRSCKEKNLSLYNKIKHIEYNIIKNIKNKKTNYNKEDVVKNKITAKNKKKLICNENNRNKIIKKIKSRLLQINNKKNIKEYVKRTKKELKVIISKNLLKYFKIAYKITKWARKNNIIVGPGRGSGSSSIISYLLQITEVDPIKNKLIFERFLTITKQKLPDLDLDFCMKKRNKIIKYLKNKLGYDKIISLITFNKYHAKNSIKDTSKINHIKYNEVNEITKTISFKENKLHLKEIIKKKPTLKEKYKKSKQFRNMIKQAISIENTIKTTGVHPGGTIILPKTAAITLPSCVINNKQKTLVSQYDKKTIEKLNILKIDILGLTTLSVLNKIKKKLKNTKLINSEKFDNKKTFELIKKGDTTGVFQLESNGIKKILKKVPLKNFNDIVNIIALYRPGPLNLVNRYIINKKVKFKNNTNQKIINNVLKETNGIMLFQEQIIEIFKRKLNISYDLANYIRVIFTAETTKKIKEILKKFKKTKGVKELFKYIKNNNGYTFNKSHAVSYAITTYRMALLKANHYIDFIISQLNFFYKNPVKLIILIQDCINHKIKIITPKVNKSSKYFCKIKKNKIMYGLIAVKNIGYKLTNIIIKEEKIKKFTSKEDFIKRLKKYINKKQYKILNIINYFKSLQKNRSDITLEKIIYYREIMNMHCKKYLLQYVKKKIKYNYRIKSIGIVKKIKKNKITLEYYCLCKKKIRRKNNKEICLRNSVFITYNKNKSKKVRFINEKKD